MPAFDFAADALRRRRVLSDRDFDALYPEPLRFVSRTHWTPIAVAARAADLLVTAGAKQVLDVGSGIGKFCIVGALSTDGAKFTGVEQRPGLVDAATRVAGRLGANRARFLCADAIAAPFSAFDGVYMYNPSTSRSTTYWSRSTTRSFARPSYTGATSLASFGNCPRCARAPSL
jgi:SAM-dependent methyltransferase